MLVQSDLDLLPQDSQSIGSGSTGVSCRLDESIISTAKSVATDGPTVACVWWKHRWTALRI